MKYNTNIHKRKSLRLKNYDYSDNGLYFITICVNGKINLFWKIIDWQNILNESWKMIEEYWCELENKYGFAKLHEYIVMPNHFHGIIEVNNDSLHVGVPFMGTQNDVGNLNNSQNYLGQAQGIAPTTLNQNNFQKTKHIWDIIWEFKSLTTNAYIQQVHAWMAQTFEKKLWQRNYYEHIIRNENSYNKISEYIKNNPKSWEQDELYN